MYMYIIRVYVCGGGEGGSHTIILVHGQQWLEQAANPKHCENCGNLNLEVTKLEAS